jgi:type II secretory ATPase GspE/PulE/Tfp pilus assembly ATPase PilB-like protein
MWGNRSRHPLVGIFVLLGGLSAASLPLLAQEQDDTDSTAKQAATESGSSARSAGTFPPSPRPFFRGSFPAGKGQGGVVGYYLSLWCFVPVLAIFLIWARTSHWIAGDSRGLKVRSSFWNSVMLVSGFLGFLLVLCIPSFPVGFVTLLLSYAVPVGLYVRERNEKVPEASKLLTRRAIAKSMIRSLARIGIHIGSPEAHDAALGPSITFIGKSTKDRDEDDARARQVENSKGYLAAKELIYDAILRRGTDVHLEPKENELSVRLRIDGMMYPTEPFDRAAGGALINIFKVLGAMDITEKRRPQDGSFRAELEGRQVDFRVASQGTRHGEKISLRILDQSGTISTLAGLGLRKKLQESLREIVHLPHGMLLCCGPTGAGKSTTLYVSLREIDAYQRNIVTVEDPVEYKIDNVNQIEINTKAGQTFATSLRSILRQDPDVVMIGEIRDRETAEIACQAANTGHMVFSTVHANDTITALYRLLELGAEPFMVANSVSAILAQRLARRLCPECREPCNANPEFLKKMGIPPDKIDHFYRPPTDPEEICPTCGGLGYKGRVGIFELLTVTDRMRDMIRDKGSLTNIRAEARKGGMLYMKEEGLRLLARGITSVDEFQRVVK